MEPTNEQGARAYRELLGEGPSDRSLLVQRATIVWMDRDQERSKRQRAFFLTAGTASLLLITTGLVMTVRPFWPAPVELRVRRDDEVHLIAPSPAPELKGEAAASLPSDATWQELYRAGFKRGAYRLITESGAEVVLTRGTESDLDLLGQLALDQGDRTLERRCQMARRARFRSTVPAR